MGEQNRNVARVSPRVRRSVEGWPQPKKNPPPPPLPTEEEDYDDEEEEEDRPSLTLLTNDQPSLLLLFLLLRGHPPHTLMAIRRSKNFFLPSPSLLLVLLIWRDSSLGKREGGGDAVHAPFVRSTVAARWVNADNGRGRGVGVCNVCSSQGGVPSSLPFIPSFPSSNSLPFSSFFFCRSVTHPFAPRRERSTQVATADRPPPPPPSSEGGRERGRPARRATLPFLPPPLPPIEVRGLKRASA